MTPVRGLYDAVANPHQQINEKLQFFFAIIIFIAIAGPGMTYAWPAVALPLLKKNDTSNDALFYDKENTAAIFASMTSVCILVACILNVFVMKTGRKTPIILIGIIATIGWIIVATSYSIVQIFIGKFIVGVGAGMMLPPAVVYLSEMSTIRYRTTLLSINAAAGATGNSLVYITGYLVRNWRYQAAICSSLPLLTTILTILLLPESPVWLLHKNRKSAAKVSLMRLRGVTTETADFTAEYDQMFTHCQQRRKIANDLLSQGGPKFQDQLQRIWRIWKLPEVWKPFLIVVSVHILQHISAMHVILAYSVDFLEHCGLSPDPFLLTVFLGLTKVVSSIALIFLTRKFRNRTLLLTACAAMCLSFFILGSYLQFIKPHDHDRRYQAIAIVTFLMYMGSATIGIYGLSWTIMGELYPSEYAHFMAPIGTCISVPVTFTSLYLYPFLVRNLGIITVIFIYSFIAFLSVIHVAVFVPESRGVPRHEIIARFQKK